MLHGTLIKGQGMKKGLEINLTLKGLLDYFTGGYL